MGLTNPTYRDCLSTIERRRGDYRRGLHRRDRQYFDRLFKYVRTHADAAGQLTHAGPLAPILTSIALVRERQPAALRERVAALEEDNSTATDRSRSSEG